MPKRPDIRPIPQRSRRLGGFRFPARIKCQSLQPQRSLLISLSLARNLIFTSNSVAHFGILEAQKHRDRGISLAMFLGLFEYYRQAYVDLAEEAQDISIDRKIHAQFINRVFDVIEVSLCLEWAGGKDDKNILNIQKSKREITN